MTNHYSGPPCAVFKYFVYGSPNLHKDGVDFKNFIRSATDAWGYTANVHFEEVGVDGDWDLIFVFCEDPKTGEPTNVGKMYPYDIVKNIILNLDDRFDSNAIYNFGMLKHGKSMITIFDTGDYIEYGEHVAGFLPVISVIQTITHELGHFLHATHTPAGNDTKNVMNATQAYLVRNFWTGNVSYVNLTHSDAAPVIKWFGRAYWPDKCPYAERGSFREAVWALLKDMYSNL